MTSSAPTTAGRKRRGRARRRRAVWLVLLALLLLLVCLGVVMALQARSANAHLQEARAQVGPLRSLLLEGDEAGVRRSADVIADEAAQARDTLDGPHWRLAAALPWVGTNVDALRTVTEVADDLARTTMPELTGLATELEPEDLQPQDGRFALRPIRQARPYAEAAARSTKAADQRLAAIEPADLVAPLSTRFVDLRGQVSTMSAAMDTAARATKILPSILGGDGPRRYVLVVQNNAEPRALGGLAASFIELRTDRGRVELVGQRSAPALDEPARPGLSKAERALFGTQLGRFVQNATGTPDFPRSAELVSRSWRATTGERLDGVAAIDPVALESLLGVTGPVDLPDGMRLTEANAAQVLLHDVYVDLPTNEAQDAFFAVAASAIFDRFLGGGVDLLQTGEVLTRVTDQGRLMFWPASTREQAVLRGTRLAGELAGEHDGAPVVGVYLHDRTQSKMGYYQDLSIALAQKCNHEPPGRLVVKVTIASRAPRNVTDLPVYVTGIGNVVARGRIASELYVYAPDGARIAAFKPSKGPKKADLVTHRGLQAAKWPLDLGPGESVTAEYVIESRSDSLDRVEVRHTPGPVDGRFRVSTSSCGQ